MKLLIFATCVSVVASLVATASSGCGSNAPSSGKKYFTDQNKQREYFINVPSGYNKNTPTPVVILFHGWGYSGAEWYSGGGWGAVSATPTSNSKNFILIAPTGLTDSSLRGNCDNGGGYCSWNAAGTTGSPGPMGKTCNTKKQKENYCYYDTCPQGCKDICSWTTCNDDTTMVHNLLDLIETQVCVDKTRVYAGGESNGGVMTWQMGTDSRAGRFAAFAPVIGLTHHGFNFLPSILPLPVMGLWGSKDKTIPHGNNNDEFTESEDGWYYTTARTITKEWSDVHGCDVSSSPNTYSTSHDGSSGLKCTSYSSGCKHGTAPIVDCRFTGGHSVPSFTPALMWEFFSKHTRSFDSGTHSVMPPSNSTYRPRGHCNGTNVEL